MPQGKNIRKNRNLRNNALDIKNCFWSSLIYKILKTMFPNIIQVDHKRRTQSKALLHSKNKQFGGHYLVLADQKY